MSTEQTLTATCCSFDHGKVILTVSELVNALSQYVDADNEFVKATTTLDNETVISAWVTFIETNGCHIVTDPMGDISDDVVYDGGACLAFATVLASVPIEYHATIRKYLLVLVLLLHGDLAGEARTQLTLLETLEATEKLRISNQVQPVGGKKFGGIMGLAQSLLDDSGALDQVRESGTAEEAMSMFLKSGMFTTLAEKLSKLSPGDIEDLLSEVNPSLLA